MGLVCVLIVSETSSGQRDASGVLFKEKANETRLVKCWRYFPGLASMHDGLSRCRDARIADLREQGELQNLRSKPPETFIATSSRFRH